MITEATFYYDGPGTDWNTILFLIRVLWESGQATSIITWDVCRLELYP